MFRPSTASPKRVKSLFLASCALSVAALLTACSGTADNSPPPTASAGATDAAKALFNEAKAPKTEWFGPTEAPTPLASATVGIIACGIAIEGCARQVRGAEKAAEVLGWKTIVVDGQGNPLTIQEGMETLINRGVDAIILASVNVQDVGEQVRTAADKGIDVIVTFSPDPTPAGGIGSISIDRFEAGRAVAAYMAVEGGGDVVVFNQNDSPEVAEQAKGLREGLKEFSPGAKILAEQSIPNTQMGAPQEQIMSGILQQNPEGTIKWVYAGFDFMLTPLVNVVDREGRKEIRGVSFDGNLENLDFIRKGVVQTAVIGYPLEWSGWGAIDQLNRSLQGKPLAKDQGVRFRLLTKDNIPSSGKSYVGDVDFEAKYRQLWGK